MNLSRETFTAAALVAATVSASALPAFATNGIIRVESPHSVEETANRYEEAAEEKGIRVFARHDHAQAAEEYDQELPPTVVLSVGNPGYGTKFMVENQVAAIDFPPKALVYEDPEGQVWLVYNSSEYFFGTIFERHGLSYPPEDVEFYAGLLEELATSATAQ